jgi:hypothetical protein
MTVNEIFFVSDGRTVFVGERSDEGFVRGPRACRLIVGDSKLLAAFEIEGEMIVEGGRPERSISTAQTIDVDPALAATGTLRLVCDLV